MEEEEGDGDGSTLREVGVGDSEGLGAGCLKKSAGV